MGDALYGLASIAVVGFVIWLTFFAGFWMVGAAFLAVGGLAAMLSNARDRRIWQNLNRYG